MKSPFPGMDPYLEAHWGDVHTSLVIYTREQLRDQLPTDLRVRVEEQVAVEAPNGAGAAFYPDVRVVESHDIAREARVLAGTAVAEPLVLPLEIEPPTLRSVQIIDVRSGNRVITAIEFLSRANKFGTKRREQYLKKQQELLEGGVNLVEIDLLRAGPYILAIPKEELPDDYCRPYRIAVTRMNPPRREAYRVALRERLPVIRIPLRRSDPDVFLDIQALIDKSYEQGDYADIDYTSGLIPSLDDADAAWAKSITNQASRGGRDPV